MFPSVRNIYKYILGYGWLFPFYAVYGLFGIMHGIRFDLKYNVKTGFTIPFDKLDYEDKDIQRQSLHYGPSPSYKFVKGLKEFKKVSSLNFHESTFVDFGCGAGRAMIIAAECGFRKVIGIELSPYLVKLCQSNIISYSRLRYDCNLTVLSQNAAEYIPPNDANVFFFYAPFGFEIYKKVIQNLITSVNLNPRTIYVLDFLGSHKSVEAEFAKQGYKTIHVLDFFSKRTYAEGELFKFALGSLLSGRNENLQILSYSPLSALDKM